MSAKGRVSTLRRTWSDYLRTCPMCRCMQFTFNMIFLSLQERHADSLIQNQHYQVCTPITAPCLFVCLFVYCVYSSVQHKHKMNCLATAMFGVSLDGSWRKPVAPFVPCRVSGLVLTGFVLFQSQPAGFVRSSGVAAIVGTKQVDCGRQRIQLWI